MLIDLLNEMSKEEIIELFDAYDNYIIENDERIASDGWVPVCVHEFYFNEYQEILEGSDEEH